MKKIINLFIIIFFIFVSFAQAQEKITSFDEKDIAQLNEELRKLDLEAQIIEEGRLDVHSKKITNVATPTASTDGTNKTYVDSMGQTAGGDLTGTYPSPTIADAKVDTATLKTAQGTITQGNTDHTALTISGGQYSFLPQLKIASAASDWTGAPAGVTTTNKISLSTSYATFYGLYNNTGQTISIQNTYVTTSGINMWVFLLIDKNTKEILTAWAAPDHPAYGNGNDFDKMPHPFGSYDKIKHEIILVDNNSIAELKMQVTKDKTLTDIIMEEYKLDMSKEEIYQPLHSGRFIDKRPELVQTIPDYIKVRKLVKMTAEERLKLKQLREQKTLEIKQIKETKENKIKQKLNLSDNELQELREVLR